MDRSALSIITAWHEAANAADLDRLTALSSDDIELGGPRGAGRGAELLRDWISRAAIHLEPRRVFQRGDLVVAEEYAEWRAPDTGAVAGRDDVASVFRVADGRVASVIRHPNLDAALAAAGLSEADEATSR